MSENAVVELDTLVISLLETSKSAQKSITNSIASTEEDRVKVSKEMLTKLIDLLQCSDFLIEELMNEKRYIIRRLENMNDRLEQ